MIDLGSFVIACDICDTYRKQTSLADSVLIVTAYLGMLIDLGSFVIACDICDTYRTQTLPGKLFDGVRFGVCTSYFTLCTEESAKHN